MIENTNKNEASQQATTSSTGRKQIKVGIIGGAGYTGGELIRLLIHHPNVELSFVNSRSNAGKNISSIHQDLIGETDLSFSSDLRALVDGSVDVIFLCVGHHEARKFMEANEINSKINIIDLSQDFRLQQNSSINGRQFVYGLPEINKDLILEAKNIANPGCFATAIQLGLLPLAKEGLLTEIYTTGITGSTGAGQSLSSTSHFSWRANNIQAYKTLSHQHIKEIHQSLKHFQLSFPLSVSDDKMGVRFVPWRGDFPRGIFISSTITCNWNHEQLIELYDDFYKDAPFTIISQEEIFVKQVVNTNKCVIQLEKVGSKLVVHSVIDNLVKGASGQAVQNMNLMFGLNECAGLNLKATAF
jgi:N-acetyl-gamma-glutamyl-phosphate reductase